MKRAFRLLPGLLSLFLAAPTVAQQYHRSSGDLLKDCSAADDFSHGACVGYVTGTIDALEGLRYAGHVPGCIPGGKTIGELTQWFVTAMRAEEAYCCDLPANVALTNIYRENCGRRW